MQQVNSKEIAQAARFSKMFARALNSCPDRKEEWYGPYRAQFLEALEPCIITMNSLFFVSEDKLSATSEGREVIAAKRSPWFVDLVKDYPGGAEALREMAIRHSTNLGNLRLNHDIGDLELTDLLNQLSTVEQYARRFEEFSDDLAMLQLSLPDSSESEPVVDRLADYPPDNEFLAEILRRSGELGEAIIREVRQAVLVYHVPVTQTFRLFFFHVIVLGHPLSQDDNPDSKSDLRDLVIRELGDIDSCQSAQIEGESLRIELAKGFSWEELELDLQDMLIVVLGIDYVVFLPDDDSE